jgi:acetylglutamate kinase
VIRVVKIGGRAQSAPALPVVLAEIARTPGTQLCVVHGGGDEVTALQRRLGGEPTFIGGRRYTSAEDVELVRMILSGTVNKRIVRQLLDVGVPAVGISGEDGDLLSAQRFDGGYLGNVGAPHAVHRRLLDALFVAGFVPVVSPLGRDAATGQGLNLNGDDAAAAIAAEVGADELFLLADVPGVLHDGRRLTVIEADDVLRFISEGLARGGMVAKLEAARHALMQGVGRVRIGNADALTDMTLGTAITLSPSAV